MVSPFYPCLSVLSSASGAGLTVGIPAPAGGDIDDDDADEEGAGIPLPPHPLLLTPAARWPALCEALLWAAARMRLEPHPELLACALQLHEALAAARCVIIAGPPGPR